MVGISEFRGNVLDGKIGAAQQVFRLIHAVPDLIFRRGYPPEGTEDPGKLIAAQMELPGELGYRSDPVGDFIQKPCGLPGDIGIAESGSRRPAGPDPGIEPGSPAL